EVTSDVPRKEEVLEYLARRVVRQRADEFHVLGNLEGGQRGPRKGADLCLGSRMALPEDEERLDLLSQCWVRHPDDCRFGHGGVLIETVLHLDRRDVLPASDDEVASPAGGVHETVTARSESAGVVPSVFEDCVGGGRIPPVPGKCAG